MLIIFADCLPVFTVHYSLVTKQCISGWSPTLQDRCHLPTLTAVHCWTWSGIFTEGRIRRPLYLCIVGFPCLLHFCIPVIAFPNYYCISSVFMFCIFHARKIVLHLPVLQFYLSPFLPARRCASAGTIVTVLRLCLLCLSQVGVLSKWMNGSKWVFLSWSLSFKQSYTVL